MESFSLIILFFALTLVSSQSQYEFPNHYFINCGSKSDTDFTGKIFLRDDNPTTFKVFGGENAVNNKNNTNSTSEIYRTARVFTKKAWYLLEADTDNTFVMVNLHFSPFVYNRVDLSTSKFNVSVSGYTLLSNFNVGNSTVIKGFIIPIQSKRKFRIVFTPLNASSPAFVNAIEAFTTPSELFRHGTDTPQIKPFGQDGDINNVSSSYAFYPVYRINVGGQPIDVDRDTLRRNWTPDDKFIVNSQSAETVKPFEGQLNYKEGFATEYDAPDDVYKTAKRLKANSSSTNDVTWCFGVKKNAQFLVRAHFCDTISTGLQTLEDAFNFFINSKYQKVINLGNNIGEVQVPFYYDFVVDSFEFGFVNVSIGPISGTNQPVLLNGLEIMELLKNSGVDTWSDDKSSKKVYVAVGCAVGVLVVVLLIGFFVGYKYRIKKAPESTKMESNAASHGIDAEFTVNNSLQDASLNLSYRKQLADIMKATNNFDDNLVIGEGGFGKVYRGTLDGKAVAVKRGKKAQSQGRPEFEQEITVLSKIHDKHLVDFIGYCEENSEMILVFEYMEKGTLQEHLCGINKDNEKLSWTRRLEICISAAQGLHYLHTGTKEGIIHRDVKSTNILLNENYIAKVADFGISRFGNSEKGETDIKGSFGYIDPEYFIYNNVTQKSDVYAFGVVLLEVLCARKAIDNTIDDANLAEWAIKQIEDGMVKKIIDPYLVDKINPNSLRIYMETVKKCLKKTGQDRPTMLEVLKDLEYALRSQEKVLDEEPNEDSIMNTSLEFSMPVSGHSPSKCDKDEHKVNYSSVSS